MAPLTKPNVNEYALFAQDAWRVTERLTFNLGVRYDYFSYAQPKIQNNNAQLLAANLRTDRIPTSGTNVAPRFGFAYKPMKDDSMVIRGGYGIYYERTPAIVLGTAFSQNAVQVLSYTLFPTDAAFPAYPNVLAAAPPASPLNIFVMAPDYRTPRTHQFSLNIEKQIGRGASFTIGYLGVHGQNLTRTRDINLVPVATRAGHALRRRSVQQQHARSATGGMPGTATSPARPNAAFGRISLFDSGADSTYNGLFLQFVKHYAHNFTFLTSYTWSKIIDDAPDATAVTVGSDDAKAAQDTVAPNLDRGPGNTDTPHRFVFSAVWDIRADLSNPIAKALVNGWQISTIAQIQSGRRFSSLVSGDPNNDGNRSTDRVPYLGRNTIQGTELRPVGSAPFARFSGDEGTRKAAPARARPSTCPTAPTSTLCRIRNTVSPAADSRRPRTTCLRQSTYDARVIQLAAKIIF